MKQVYHNYNQWEDYQNGMFETSINPSNVLKSKKLLSNPYRFTEVAMKVVKSWVNSAEQNLTDNSINKKAWVGQSACCFNHGANKEETSAAWFQMTESQKRAANNAADNVIRIWESEIRSRTIQKKMFDTRGEYA